MLAFALFSPNAILPASEVSSAQLLIQGESFSQQGNFEEAARSFSAAAHQFETEENPQQQGQALLRLAHTLTQLGQFLQAQLVLEFTITLEQTLGDLATTSLAMGQLGNVLLVLDKHDKGIALLRQSLELARQDTQPLLVASLLNDLGNAWVTQKEYDQAMAAYTESYALAQSEDAHPLAVRALINSGFVALHQHSIDDAVERFNQARGQLRIAPPAHDTAAGLLSIGNGYTDLVRQTSGPQQQNLAMQAAQTFHDAATLAASIEDWRTESYGWGFLGHLYEEEERWEESLELTRRAILASQRMHAPESLYRWEWQMGRLLRTVGQHDQAILSYQRAIYTLQPIRRELAFGFKEPSSFRQTIGPMFFELADLLIKQGEAAPEAKIQQAILLQVRNTIEGFKAAELQDYFKDDCVEATQARIQTIDQVSTNTAIIYPIIFPDRTELLVSLGGTITQFTIPISEKDLTQSVRSFRRLLEKRTTRQYLPHAQSLYDLLIRPMEPLLEKFQVETLVFVPDGALRTIPMGPLHDGTKFLIEKYAMATTPGLTLTDADSTGRGELRMLSVGLTEATQGFSPLPNVKGELAALTRLYDGETLLNDEFVISRMEESMKKEQFSIVHIASHGKFEAKVEDSFLLAFDGKLTMNRLDELVGLFQFRDTPLDLLTLSACETAAGDDRAALGLAGVAIKAGARSALATLWFINDKASSDIIETFYKELKNPSISKAQALRHAQLTLLAHPAYRHPSYWSPFLMINNWL
ncbi:MAG: CHAT domain-containing protein [Nitrospirota bacterium]|nr:CHAT domain-containing protein [Nitrospirota bacterium]